MKTSILVSISLIVLAFAATSASAQTVYTYAGGNNGTWSTDSNWTSSNGGTTFPGSGGVAGNTDVADINNVTASQNVNYDTASSGFLGSLNLAETSAFTNEVTLQRSLTLTNALSLSATGGGTAEIIVGSQALSVTGNLTIGTGGLLSEGSGAGLNLNGSTNTIAGTGSTLKNITLGDGTTGDTVSLVSSFSLGGTTIIKAGHQTLDNIAGTGGANLNIGILQLNVVNNDATAQLQLGSNLTASICQHRVSDGLGRAHLSGVQLTTNLELL